jgi:nucleoside 2-deoxyribosyltransferase
MMPRVYLAGAIYGTTDADQEWRRIAAERLAGIYDVLNPLDRDYRGTKFDTVNSSVIVKEDMLCVDNSSVVLANCDKPGWGTAMEIFYAHMKGKPVLFFTSNENPSPWLLARARNVGTLENAINELTQFKDTILNCAGNACP